MDTIYETLKAVPRLIVYKKDDIPDEFHYRKNRRVQSIVVSVPEGYTLCLNKSSTECQLKGMYSFSW